MKDQPGIYRITHQPTGLWYAGASVTPAARLQAHRRALRRALAAPDGAKGWPMRLMAHLTQPESPDSLIRHWWLRGAWQPRWGRPATPMAPPRVVLPVESDLLFEVVEQCAESIAVLREVEERHQGPLNHPAGRPYGDHARIKGRFVSTLQQGVA